MDLQPLPVFKRLDPAGMSPHFRVGAGPIRIAGIVRHNPHGIPPGRGPEAEARVRLRDAERDLRPEIAGGLRRSRFDHDENATARIDGLAHANSVSAAVGRWTVVGDPSTGGEDLARFARPPGPARQIGEADRDRNRAVGRKERGQGDNVDRRTFGRLRYLDLGLERRRRSSSKGFSVASAPVADGDL